MNDFLSLVAYLWNVCSDMPIIWNTYKFFFMFVFGWSIDDVVVIAKARGYKNGNQSVLKKRCLNLIHIPIVLDLSSRRILGHE